MGQFDSRLATVITTVSPDLAPAQEAAVKADALLGGSLLTVVKNLTRTQTTRAPLDVVDLENVQ